MGKKTDPKPTLTHDFQFGSDADLNAAIATFVAEHARTHKQRLAMDSRRSLGAGKVRITFRVVEDASTRGKRG